MVEEEHVLVVPTQLFHDIGYFQGFSSNVGQYFEAMLGSGETSYRPRGQMETDPSFKQLIPYVVFRHLDDSGKSWLFQYQRGSGQGEARLHSKRSVGVGGHISSFDSDCHDPYLAGMIRELDEEIDLSAAAGGQPGLDSIVGLINDDSNDVGKVHLGIVHLIDVKTPVISSREKDLCDAGFWDVAQLSEQFENFETWSQIALQSILESEPQIASRSI